MSGRQRLAAVFSRCKTEGRAALVGFLTAGDPGVQESKQLLLALAAEVDVLEIGMPFSDPMADGAVIQAASERALEAGTKLADLFALAAAVRRAHPALGIVLMGYGNTALATGMEHFANNAANAGVDGVLLVDIPPEEGAICDDALAQAGLARILLLAPTSSEARMQLVGERATGFIYYVSLTGITGAKMGAVETIAGKVAAIRQHTNLPVCVGFGVKSAGQAAAIAKVADGVVVGSQFVGLVAQHRTDIAAAVAALAAEAGGMRRAIMEASLI
ncbi:MAG: tryptophan synthase subunit alpha [Mariprofundales bacterium]|nr:tryptophan synthase subunit alpha [Mariprofundales bacterium]